MEKFKIVIEDTGSDYGLHNFIVEADNIDEAEEKAMEKYAKEIGVNPDFLQVHNSFKIDHDMRKQFDKMVAYAGKYQISIQFWGEGDTNVFIEKDGVPLTDFGGLDPETAIDKTVEYLDRINGK